MDGNLTGPLVNTEEWVVTGWSIDTYTSGLGWTVEGTGNASFVEGDDGILAVFPGGAVEGRHVNLLKTPLVDLKGYVFYSRWNGVKRFNT